MSECSAWKGRKMSFPESCGSARRCLAFCLSRKTEICLAVYRWQQKWEKMINGVSVLKATQSWTSIPHSHPDCCHIKNPFGPSLTFFVCHGPLRNEYVWLHCIIKDDNQSVNKENNAVERISSRNSSSMQDTIGIHADWKAFHCWHKDGRVGKRKEKKRKIILIIQ